ncbi:DUF4153 domain-containing protein [Jeotgalibacillus proteolyticus]|uniref:DUF4153 domain-containing protein n=1 Tax=Jeotgalibacillus proteolyticus TaxID=2082395 RepID=UPI003CF0F42F
MSSKLTIDQWWILLWSLFLGFVLDKLIFIPKAGISYVIFVILFYIVFFIVLRNLSFYNRRMGNFLLICILVLSTNYFLYDQNGFYLLNFLVIPALMFLHYLLRIQPKSTSSFFTPQTLIPLGLKKLTMSVNQNVYLFKYCTRLFSRNMDEQKRKVWSKIFYGLLLSMPLLFIVIALLMSSDLYFTTIMTQIPTWFTLISANTVQDILIVLLFGCLFYGFFQAAFVYTETSTSDNPGLIKGFDQIVVMTLLILLNLVYLFYLVIQFAYFFNGDLAEGFTYAEYARRGFFELVTVTMINLTLTVLILHFVKQDHTFYKKSIQILLSFLLGSSLLILISAFMRLHLYEQAYGFTFTRILVHAFIIFLFVIIIYTMMKVWLQRLSLIHFYILSALIFYCTINIINIDGIVVDRNLERYTLTGKIDLNYLNQMSDTGKLGLIKLYQINPDVTGLEDLVVAIRGEKLQNQSGEWQSYNLTEEQLIRKLQELTIN